MTESMEIPPELFARLAHPTVRPSGSIDEATAASFLSQVLPVLEVPGSIVVELFSSGGAVEVDDWPKKFAYCVRLMGVTCGSSARRSSRQPSLLILLSSRTSHARRWKRPLSVPASTIR